MIMCLQQLLYKWAALPPPNELFGLDLFVYVCAGGRLCRVQGTEPWPGGQQSTF